MFVVKFKVTMMDKLDYKLYLKLFTGMAEVLGNVKKVKYM